MSATVRGALRVIVTGPQAALAGLAEFAARDPSRSVVATTPVPADIVRLAIEQRAELVLVHRDIGDDNVLALLDRTRPMGAIGVAVMSPEADAAFERRALRAGALDVVCGPTDDATLDDAVAELWRRRDALPQRPPEAAAPRAAARAAPLIAVVSAKGGVGRSFVAANLASLLAKDRRVALCDLDLQFGELSHWGAAAPPERSIDHLTAIVGAGEVQRADVDTVAVTRFGAVTLLPGAGSPVEGAAWASDRGARALRLAGALRRWFDVVVVDDLPGLLEPVVGIARSATLLVVVTTAEVGAVRATKRYLALLDRYAPTPRLVVVNRANKGLASTLVREALGGERVHRVNEDRTFARRLVVEGLAAAQQRGRGVTRAFGRLAEAVTTATRSA